MDIREFLARGEPLLFDGAMGTCFAARPGREGRSCELASLDSPQEILDIHRAYLQAGCRAVKTDTFGVSALLAQGEEDLARRIVEAGFRLAREAAAPFDAWVFADLGPAPQGKGAAPGDLYCRQAGLFLEQGAVCFLAETLPSDEGIPQLARYLKEACPEAFLIVSFAVDFDGVTREGRRGSELLRAAAALPQVDGVGFNCVSGPHHLLEYVRGLDLPDKYLSVMPNAGYPTVTGRRTYFQGRPDYFGEKMARMVQAGASIVGGCCGTGPEHIAALARQLSRPLPRILPRAAAAPERPAPPPSDPFWEKLCAGERVTAVELDPPADDGIGFFLEGARSLVKAGADIVTVADCPVGRPRADSCLLACKLGRELGIQALPHMTCRDRNLNATKALLLGLSIEGIHNVLLVTGDPIPSEEREEVKSVFNFNSRKLARYVSGLEGHGLSAPFHIFAALNLNARNFRHQLAMAREKEDCGVSGFLTQPVHSLQALENLKLAREELKGKILGGIFPIVSHRNACFLNNEIAGMNVCGEIVELYRGKDKEQAEELAVAVSARIAREIAPYTDGCYLMTPFRRVGLMTRILAEIT
ncbi:MAG: bifunctional homocysteine S-methyltransferase/methylenetetrahydrofolate reductase [Lawsonibacter sp.]|nr:bifunctional homocysteine S-methyltransferase/methylenetetrahydrofolate reductase [Lawsonibacter sp.]